MRGRVDYKIAVKLQQPSYLTGLLSLYKSCVSWGHLRLIYCQHSLHRQTLLLVGSHAASPPIGTVFPPLYALLTVSLVLCLSSRLPCSQDISSRFAVCASDTLTRSFARYKFVIYLPIYIKSNQTPYCDSMPSTKSVPKRHIRPHLLVTQCITSLRPTRRTSAPVCRPLLCCALQESCQ